MSCTAKTKMRNDTDAHINTPRGCHNHPFLHYPPFPTSGCFTHCKVPLPCGNKYSHYPFMSAGRQRRVPTHTTKYTYLGVLLVKSRTPKSTLFCGGNYCSPYPFLSAEWEDVVLPHLTTPQYPHPYYLGYVWAIPRNGEAIITLCVLRPRVYFKRRVSHII